MSTNLFSVLRVVQSQAPNSLDLLWCKGAQEQPDVGNIVRHIMLAKDITRDDAGLLCLSYVRHALWQDSISIVGVAVLCKETDKSLSVILAKDKLKGWHRDTSSMLLTVKVAILTKRRS